MGTAFSRLMAMSQLFSSLLGDKATAENAFHLSGLATYQSRGKGRNKPFVGSHFSNKSRQGSRSKYMPHQGKQEIARRMRQDDAAHRKFIDSVVSEIDERRHFFLGDPHLAPSANQNKGERLYG